MMSANGKLTEAKIFVVNGFGGKSLMSRYTAFDLAILNITVDQLTAGMHNPHVRYSPCQEIREEASHDLSIAQHLSYDEIADLVTPRRVSEEKLQ